MNETFNFLLENGITSLTDLEGRVESCRRKVDVLKETLDQQTARMRTIRKLYDDIETLKRLQPVFDNLQKIKFTRSKEKYKSEHDVELRQYHAICRKLNIEFPDSKVSKAKLKAEYSRIQSEHEVTYAEFKELREESQKLWKVKYLTDVAKAQKEQGEHQKTQSTPDQEL